MDFEGSPEAEAIVYKTTDKATESGESVVREGTVLDVLTTPSRQFRAHSATRKILMKPDIYFDYYGRVLTSVYRGHIRGKTAASSTQ